MHFTFFWKATIYPFFFFFESSFVIISNSAANPLWSVSTVSPTPVYASRMSGHVHTCHTKLFSLTENQIFHINCECVSLHKLHQNGHFQPVHMVQSISVCCWFFFFTFSYRCLKCERHPAVLFFFYRWKRSVGAEVVISPSVADRCTTHI